MGGFFVAFFQEPITIMAALSLNQAFASGGLTLNQLGSGGLTSNGLTYNQIAPGYNPASVYTPPKPQVLGASTYKAPAAARPAAPTNNIPQGPTPQQMVQSGQDNGNQQIESDYNAAMGMANNAEGSLRGQAATAEGEITSGGAAARNEIINNQGIAEQGINTSLQTAETQNKTGMQQARDLFRQTQQTNNAQLSALGISSSSVSEALAERLGVETARRIGGLGDSIGQIRVNAQNELTRTKNYYTGKLESVTSWVNNEKSKIQNSLLQGLNQINSARDQAASAKSQARANLLQTVQSQLGQIAQQQQQFEQSLKQWAEQRSAALTPIAQDPNYIQNLIAQTQNIQSQFNPSQFMATPQVSVDKYGNYTGQISLQKPPKQEEDPNDPSAGWGATPAW